MSDLKKPQYSMAAIQQYKPSKALIGLIANSYIPENMQFGLSFDFEDEQLDGFIIPAGRNRNDAERYADQLVDLLIQEGNDITSKNKEPNLSLETIAYIQMTQP